MSKIRLSKEFGFEMAHALDEYEGPCRHIHGHSYTLIVTILGMINTVNSDQDQGMVIDFSVIKKIINTHIITHFDHTLVLNSKSSYLKEIQNQDRLIKVDYQPTCENLLVDFVHRIEPFLPEHIKLHHIFLRETPSSYAEWYAEDNVT